MDRSGLKVSSNAVDCPILNLFTSLLWKVRVWHSMSLLTAHCMGGKCRRNVKSVSQMELRAEQVPVILRRGTKLIFVVSFARAWRVSYLHSLHLPWWRVSRKAENIFCKWITHFPLSGPDFPGWKLFPQQSNVVGQFQQEENPSEEGLKEAILSNLDMLSFRPLRFFTEREQKTKLTIVLFCFSVGKIIAPRWYVGKEMLKKLFDPEEQIVYWAKLLVVGVSANPLVQNGSTELGCRASSP